ncbi:caspase family protein, partial [Paracoccus ravus]|uniref:caspase family protein n=1 Tax=Paracoccus ravus TaxID=2447760 RepID=UPI001AD9E7DF
LTKHSHDLRFRETALSHSNLLSSRYEKILLMQPLNHGEDYQTFDLDTAFTRYQKDKNMMLFRNGVDLATALLSEISTPGDGTIVIIVDACRTNPLDSVLKQRLEESIFTGNPVEMLYSKPQYNGNIPPGIKIVFSTSKGDSAEDGGVSGSLFNILFTQQLELHRDKSIDVALYEASLQLRKITGATGKLQDPQFSGMLDPSPPPTTCIGSC